MRNILIFFVAFSTFVLSMCASLPERELANPIAGLSCRPSAGQDMECYYTCPEGTVGPLRFEGDPSLSLSKSDFDLRFCENVPPSTSTAPIASPSASASLTSSPSAEPSATVMVPVTAQDPYLAETVSMCDLGGKLINFRISASSPEITNDSLDVQIADRESSCYVNPTNRALLTCRLPNDFSFPVHVVVSLDGVLVNDFTFDGAGCAILTTPTPSKIQSYP